MVPPTSTRRESPTPSASEKRQRTSSSDNESGGEKPVREKLRDTNITAQPQATSHPTERTSSPNSDAEPRLQKKRSFEDVDSDAEDEEGEPTRHVRKRSREAVGTDDVVFSERVGSRTPEPEKMDESTSGLTSPKNKRTRDQVEEVVGEEGEAEVETPEERETKRKRDAGEGKEKEQNDKIKPKSGFANTSTASPFGAAVPRFPPSAENKEGTALPQTSNDKFKASGFSTFARSASPFGGAQAKGTSVFGGAPATTSPWAATPATQPSAFGAATAGKSSGFGNTSTTSAFGNTSTTSGFGNTSSTSAFGSLAKPSAAFSTGFGGGALSAFGSTTNTSTLSPFAGGSGPTLEGLSSKKTKAFGAANDTDDEDEGDTDADTEDGIKSPVHTHEGERKDRRFFEQAVETGEEGETTVFSQRAKLYQFVKGESKWVERGTGTLKLNVGEVGGEADSGTAGEGEEKEEDEQKFGDGETSANGEEKPRKARARFVMRADGSQRVVLNSPLKKGTRFGGSDGTEPRSQAFMFLGSLEASAGTLETLQMKMNAERAKVLWGMVRELQERL